MNHPVIKKTITSVEAMAIVVGMIIGSGIFLKPGIVLSHGGTPLRSILAWVIGGVVTLAAALSIAEISAVIPQSGGLYTYLEKLYGDAVGFLLGWVQVVVSSPAGIAAQSIAFATYAQFFIAMNQWQQKLLALFILGFLLTMNVLATKFGGVIQTLTTVGKLIPLIAIVVFGLFFQETPGFNGISAVSSGSKGGGLGTAILGTLWAYEGWLSVTNLAGELKNPAKILPRVLSLGVVIVILVYVLFNLAIFAVLPVDVMKASHTPATDAAKAIFGDGGGAFITLGIMVSVFGSLNGLLMTGARVPQVMSARKQLPFSRILKQIHPRFGTPANALIFQAILSVIYIFSGTFNTLTDLLVFVLWIFFTMGVMGVFILRRNVKPVSGRYRVPFYPVTPIVGMVGGCYIIISTIINQPVQSMMGICITLAGLPTYYWLKKRPDQT